MLFDQEANKLQAGFERLEWLKYASLNAGIASFETNCGILQVSSPGVNLLRLQLKQPSQPDAPDYAILVNPNRLETDTASASIQVGTRQNAGTDEYHLTFLHPGSSESIELVFQQNPVRMEIYHGGKRMLESSTDRTIRGGLRLAPFSASPDAWILALALPSGESVFGLGEKFGDLDKRGQLIENWNRDATGVNAEISYKNVPFAWSPNGWGVFVHTTARVTHGVGYSPWSHRAYVIKVADPTLDVFFVFANTPAQMLFQYTELTGRTELPPRWSYGVWMSRAFYKTADEILNVARQMRQHNIPCDVLTLDGRAWHQSETRFDFSWDPVRYPDPAGFVQTLREMNFRLCLWEYSYLSSINPLFNELASRKYFLQTPSGDVYIHRWLPEPFDKSIAHLQPSGLIDFTNPEAYAWYRDMHRSLFEIGVSVMKTDYGEAIPEEVVGYNGDTGKRLHNIYTLLYNRCVFEASQNYGEKDGIVWGRSSWAGGQRYPVQWGGDPQSDWEGLASSIRGGLSWGMSGGAFYTHDIGGFYGVQEGSGLLGEGLPDAELYIRWAQAGVMASHTRFHGTSAREPWVFGEETETIIRKWLAWRYQLIPYLQGCAIEAKQTGLPVMRSMVLAFPKDRLAWQFDTQYMLGDSLLVAPVITSGGIVNYYLPSGNWFDIWNQTWVQGPGLFEMVIPLEYIPVFGREGTILPLGPGVQHTGELKEGIDLEKIWIFGTPRHGMTLPGTVLTVSSDGELENVPINVSIERK
jgi:alpha-D-xyloside xylohydrolase